MQAEGPLPHLIRQAARGVKAFLGKRLLSFGMLLGIGLLLAVSFRYRDGTQKNTVPVADAVAEIVTAVRDRVQV